MCKLKRCLTSLLSLFTRLPAPSGTPEDAARCSWLLPLIGFIIGSLEALPVLVQLPALFEASIWFITHIYFTGGIHLDGLLDYFDAVLPGFRGEQAIRVMKDPRKGAGAVLAAISYSLLFLAAAVYLIKTRPLLLLLISASSFAYSYTVVLLLLARSPPEPYQGLARLFQSGLRGSRTLLLAFTGFALTTPALILYPVGAALACLVAAFTGYLVYRDAVKRLGFMNGDVAGAGIELARLAYLDTLVIFISLHRALGL